MVSFRGLRQRQPEQFEFRAGLADDLARVKMNPLKSSIVSENSQLSQVTQIKPVHVYNLVQKLKF